MGMNMNYYEIIDAKYTGDVLGVCYGADMAHWDWRNYVGLQFGQISEPSFDRFNNKPWKAPKSKVRFAFTAEGLKRAKPCQPRVHRD
jgi:hypothetical protein